MGAIADYYANSNSLGWVLTSKKDPRWNCSGNGGETSVKARIKVLKAEFGEQPDDLMLTACKAD